MRNEQYTAGNNSNIGEDGLFSMEDFYYYLKNENIRKPIYKVEILNKDSEKTAGNIYGYVENNSGSLTINNTEGIRRTVSLNLSNFKHEFTAYFSTLSIGQKFKLWLGYEINGENYLFAQGVFVYSNPSLVSDLSNKSIQISGSDKWSILNGEAGGILQSTYQINKGSKVGELITRTLQLEIVRDYTPPNIEKEVWDLTTTYDIIHEAGETVADVLLEVAFNLSCYIYYNQDGELTFRPFEYDIELPSLYDFSYNDINYLTSSRMYDIQSLYNAVKIVADNMQNENAPIVAYLENKDASDPNSIISGATLKVYHVTDYVEGIDTQQKADERSRYELKKVVAMQSSLSISGNAMYHLYENTIVTITDPYVGAKNERFLINNITFDIGSNGQMTLNVIKARGYL